MKNIFFFVILIGILISCDNDNSTNEISQKAKLTIKVFDNDGNPIHKAYVRLNHQVVDYDNKVNNPTVFEDSTDDFGTSVVEQVLEGDYSVSCTTKSKIYNYYYDKVYFQVIDGQNKTVTLSPYSYVVNVSILVLDKDDNNVRGINVAVLSASFQSLGTTYGIKYMIDNAYCIGKTDNNGVAIIDGVPDDISYTVLVYWDTTNYYFDGNGGEANPRYTRRVKMK